MLNLAHIKFSDSPPSSVFAVSDFANTPERKKKRGIWKLSITLLRAMSADWQQWPNTTSIMAMPLAISICAYLIERLT